MPRAGRPIANTRWEISIESQDGNYIIRESNRESTLSQKDRTARIEKGKDLPVVDAKKVVWYLYNKEDALCENWTLEQAPVPAEIHTVTYVVDMKAYCAESRGEEPKLSDLLHTTPPPRLPVKGNISFGWPRHPGYYFTPILRNGLFETEEAGSFDGGMRPVTYQWKNYATLLSAAKSKPESHPEEEWLADLIKLDLSYRKAFQPHLDAIAKMRFRAKQTTGNEAAAFAEEVLRQGEREQLLAGDPATLRSHPTLTELETHAEVGPNYKAYLDYNGKLVLFLFLPS